MRSRKRLLLASGLFAGASRCCSSSGSPERWASWLAAPPRYRITAEDIERLRRWLHVEARRRPLGFP